MAVKKKDDQHEHTFSSSVRIRNVVLKNCLGRWTIGRSCERASGISVLPAWHDDDYDGYICISCRTRKPIWYNKDIYIYIQIWNINLYLYIYIYIYVCVCVCVCIWVFLYISLLFPRSLSLSLCLSLSLSLYIYIYIYIQVQRIGPVDSILCLQRADDYKLVSQHWCIHMWEATRGCRLLVHPSSRQFAADIECCLQGLLRKMHDRDRWWDGCK